MRAVVHPPLRFTHTLRLSLVLLLEAANLFLRIGNLFGPGGPAIGGLPLRFDAKVSELALDIGELFGDFD